MKKSKGIVIAILSIILIGNLFVSCSKGKESNEVLTNGKINSLEYTEEEINEAVEVIKNSFKYANEKNIIDLKDCYTSRHMNSDFRLFNLESKELKEVALLTEEKNYSEYMEYGTGKINGVERRNIIAFRVKSSIQYIDDNIEPVDSGINETGYTLIREKNLGGWKIEEVGEPYHTEGEVKIF